MLPSGKGWPDAVLKLVSITICEHSTWILRFIDAWLTYTILGIELSVQVLVCIEQFYKNTEQFGLNAILYLKMSGIITDGSFILYNNEKYLAVI